MKILKWLIPVTLLCASAVFAPPTFSQGVRVDNITLKAGSGIAGVNIAVCQPLATTAASVTPSFTTYTMASNPITAGFKVGMQVQVAGFTGGDAIFNAGTIVPGSVLTGGQIILSVTATQIITNFTHANQTAGVNGTVFQMGNTTTSCAGLASLFTDATATVPSTNPVVTDSLGNYGFWATPAQYIIQIYSSNVPVKLYFVSLACVPNATVVCTGLFSGATVAGQVIFGGAGPDVLASDASFTYSVGNPLALSATSPATGGANFTAPNLQFNSNYWNGAASTLSRWTVGPSLGAGANPFDTFIISNTYLNTILSLTMQRINLFGIVASAAQPILCWNGTTSGTACFQVNAAAGAPIPISWPNASPTSVQQCWMGATGSPNNLTWKDCGIVWAKTDLTNQGAATGTVTLANTVNMFQAGQYQLNWDAKVTVVDAVSSTLGAMTITYVDPDGNTQTITAAAVSKTGTLETTDTGNVLTTVLLGVPLTLNCGANTAITYSFAYTSNTPGQMKYNLHLRLTGLA